MRIEASSSTSPFSKRSTMVSSSFSACSKLMLLISESVGSAMIWLSSFLHSGSRGPAHQRCHVHRSRACQGIEVVSPLERRDKPASGMLGSRFQQLLGHPGEIRLDEPELRQRVLEMCVEAG